MSLARSILESHPADPSPGRSTDPLKVRPDALFVDPERGRLSLGRFASFGAAPSCELIVATDAPESAGWIGAGPDAAAFGDLARACRARIAPPGARPADTRALAPFAAPAP